MNFLRSGLTTIREFLDWLPPLLVALLILAISLLIALAAHRWLRFLLRRVLEGRRSSLLEILTQTHNLTQLAFILIAVIVAVPVMPLDADTSATLARIIAIGIITCIGWAAIVALNIAAGFYLRRFRLDVEDNLMARKHNTQVRVLVRAVDVVLIILTIGAALMTFPAVRQYGVSLFASAGAAGIIVGLAARPLLSNLFAGIQLAITQPIRIDDAVIVENEWGRVEEITSTYVVVRIWDLRRMIVPLSYFIERPFQNWTRHTSALIGSAMFYLDYSAPVGAIRAELERIVKASESWNGEVVNLQVTDAGEHTIELRAIMSANSSGAAFNLRCEVREKLIAFLQREHPDTLPRRRNDVRQMPVKAQKRRGKAVPAT
jgi:small-conductance mechanosensitive channel